MIVITTDMEAVQPSIAAAFGEGKRINWVVDAYLVGQAAPVVRGPNILSDHIAYQRQPFIGRISDVAGRKNVTLAMTVLFFASTLGSGLAPNLGTLM